MTFISLPVELPRPVRISWALCAAIAVHLLLVASFFIVLAMATTAARADEITCTGNDLFEGRSEVFGWLTVEHGDHPGISLA